MSVNNKDIAKFECYNCSKTIIMKNDTPVQCDSCEAKIFFKKPSDFPREYECI